MDWIRKLKDNGLIVSTGNVKKIEEFKRMFEPRGIHVDSAKSAGLEGEPEENQDTFEGNASIKALFAAKKLGRPALADDSGLEVDALNGEPGVFSARYGGDGLSDKDRYLLLLRNMKDIPSEKRSARFVSVLALALPDGDVKTFRGEVEGRIMFEARGESGFGYDPVFLHEESGLSFAELSPAQKDRVSHRGRALVRLMEFLFRE